MTSALFDTGVDEDVVKELEKFDLRPDVVRKWTPEKAAVALEMYRRDADRTVRRAEAVARGQEEVAPRGEPSCLERQIAAGCIEKAKGKGVDELSQCIAYSIYTLTDDDTRRLADIVIGIMREG